MEIVYSHTFSLRRLTPSSVVFHNVHLCIVYVIKYSHHITRVSVYSIIHWKLISRVYKNFISVSTIQKRQTLYLILYIKV